MVSKLANSQVKVMRRMAAGETLYFDAMNGRHFFSNASGREIVSASVNALIRRGLIRNADGSELQTRTAKLTAGGKLYLTEIDK